MDEQRLREGSNLYRLKCLMGDMALYAVPAAVIPLIGLITMPLLTSALSKKDFGSVELAISYVTLLTAIANLGQDSAFARYYYQEEEKTARTNVLMLSLLVLLASASVASLAACIVFPALPVIAGIFSGKSFFAGYLPMVLLIPFIVWFNFSRVYFKWLYKRGMFVLISIAYPALLVACYLLFVKRAGSFESVLLSQLFAYSTAGVVAFFFMRTDLKTAPAGASGVRSLLGEHRALAANLVKFGAPYACLSLFMSGARALDKTVLGHFHSVADVATYAVGFKIASLMLFVETVFNMAWGPMAMSIYKEKNADVTYNSALVGLASFLSVAMLAIFFFAEDIVALLSSKEYMGAVGPLKILMIGFAFQAMAGITGIGIDLSKRSYLLVVSWGSGFLISLIGLYSLVPGRGYVGAAIAMAVGMVSEAAIRTWLSYRSHKIRFEFHTALTLIGFSAGVMLFFGFGGHGHIAESWGTRMFFIALSVLMAAFFFRRALHKIHPSQAPAAGNERAQT